MYIVTDFIQGKTLAQKLLEDDVPFNEAEAAYILNQLASAINHCHSKNIIHCDIKPENIMIDENNNVTLIDFGLSKIYSKKLLEFSCGTPAYMAPECLMKKYTDKCDVWSFGIILYILMTGRLPFEGDTPK